MSELNNNEKLIVDFLLENQIVANKQAIEITGLSSAQVRRIFVSLQHKGIIEAHGKGRGRYYVIMKKDKVQSIGLFELYLFFITSATTVYLIE